MFFVEELNIWDFYVQNLREIKLQSFNIVKNVLKGI